MFLVQTIYEVPTGTAHSNYMNSNPDSGNRLEQFVLGTGLVKKFERLQVTERQERIRRWFDNEQDYLTLKGMVDSHPDALARRKWIIDNKVKVTTTSAII
jgi:hypothetical protein